MTEDGRNVKLGEFGSSQQMVNGETFTDKFDILSFGCVLHELMTLENLPDYQTEQDIITNILDRGITLAETESSLNNIRIG